LYLQDYFRSLILLWTGAAPIVSTDKPDRLESLMNARTIDIAGLYIAEQSRLKRLVKRLVRNRTTAEDLVQQAFLKLMVQADHGDLANVPAYLAVTVRNLALNHMRNTALRAEVELADGELYALPDTRPSPEMTVLYRSELRRVLQAVATLPPRRREAFILHKFEGLTYDEIAVRQGVSRNTVITQIVSALADLDRRLGRQ
jgi:RNA polymerase sigma-70 factor (ECF subfamily)